MDAIVRRAIVGLVVIVLSPVAALAAPPGFIEEVVGSGFDLPVGLAFGPNDRIFVWEKGGTVWIVEDGQTLPDPLIDIRDEVNTYWTRGMTGFALDPDYANNGFVYLAYTMDWEWWITGGNPNPNNLDTIHDTFGVIVRYTSDPDDDFRSLIPESRWVMIGDSPDNGFPVTFASHTQNSIVFAPDGSMLVSGGDGASMSGVDVGGPRPPCCSSNTAEQDGIISETEQVGAYRSQLLNTHAGKILRIDPATAEGLPDNPFYDADAPSSPRSRVWLLGLRNPYTFAIRPGTGEGNNGPGVLMIGDVGWNTWERLVVAPEGGLNFGWPIIEGLVPASTYPNIQVPNLDAPNPLFDGVTCTQEFFYFTDLWTQETLNQPSFPNPCDANAQIPSELTFENTRGVLAWRNSRVFNFPLSMVPIFDFRGNAIQVPVDSEDSPVEGEHLRGVGTVGGLFYDGDKWPEEYVGQYYLGEAGTGGGQIDGGWIQQAEFDENHNLVGYANFRQTGTAAPTGFAIDPDGYGLYFAHHFPSPGGEIRRITYDCNGNLQGDDRDIAQGISLDLNGNGIADECEFLGDGDQDGDVDEFDFEAFLACFTRPGAEGLPPECVTFDVLGDNDVDFADFAFLQQLYTGACGLTIIEQPADVAACEGESAVFTVEAVGENLTYQWQFNGGDLPGETGDTLTIENAGSNDEGLYRCLIGDGCDEAVLSDEALLTVSDLTVINGSPTGGEFCVGDGLFLIVNAMGANTFQWFKDGQPIPGANTAFYAIPSLSEEDSGTYHVDAIGACNTATSDGAEVVVEECP